MTRRKASENITQTTVKVGRTGSRVDEFVLEGDEPTVGDALEAAGLSTSKGDRIRINGEVAEEDDIVENDDIVTVSGKVSGGM